MTRTPMTGSPMIGATGPILATLLLACLVAAPAPAESADGVDEAPPASKAPASIRFEEIGEGAGVGITHPTRSFGDRHKAQVLEMFTEGGAASAVGDYNNDGFDDLFVVDSGEGKVHHLMRNNGTRPLTFTEVTETAGVGGGNDPLSIVADAIWLDYDNDGRLDLLVGRFGTPILYRNNGPDAAGKHRFSDVSRRAGLTKFGNTIGMIAVLADIA